jgi:hypothetical protein
VSQKRLCAALVGELEALRTRLETAAAGAPAAFGSAIDAFNAWFASTGPRVNKLRAAAVPRMRLGTLAVAPIAPGEVYLEVPVRAVMSRDSAAACPALGRVFRELSAKYTRGDAFHELLLHLMYERFVAGNVRACAARRGERGRPIGGARVQASFWAPYIALLPSAEETGFPIFFTDADRAELRGSAMSDELRVYSEGALSAYNGLRRAVLSKFPDVFPPDVFNFDNYKCTRART